MIPCRSFTSLIIIPKIQYLDRIPDWRIREIPIPKPNIDPYYVASEKRQKRQRELGMRVWEDESPKDRWT